MTFERLESRVLLAADLPAVYVNAGGAAYVDSIGRTFAADAGFSGGQAVQSPSVDVLNTTDDALFLDYRKGSSFTWSLAIPNAKYAVWLEFSEPTFTTAGQRAFDVSAESQQVLNDFDIVAAAGAGQTAVAKSFDVAVTDGQLNLSFTGAGASDAIVSAIAVVPRDPTDAAAPYSWLNYADSTRTILSQSHLRSIGQSLYLYAGENKGNFPPNLTKLQQTQSIRHETFANPRTSTLPPRGELTALEKVAWVDSRNDYLYRGAGKKSNIAATEVLAYENPDRQNGDISILWGDAHVSSMTRSSAAALIGFPDAPPSDPPPAPPVVGPVDAKILQSQQNLRAIASAMLTYANEHRGLDPQQMGDLFETGLITDVHTFIDPRGTTQPPSDSATTQEKIDWINASSDYFYLAAGMRSSTAPYEIVVTENPAQVQGGLNVLFADGSAEFHETRWASESLASTAPKIVNKSFTVLNAPNQTTVLFNRGINPASALGSDLEIQNLDTGAMLDGALLSATVGPTSRALLVFDAPGYPGGILPNGNYRLHLPAGAVSNPAGVGNRDEFTLDVYVLAGDADRNRVVDIQDFNLLATWFGASTDFQHGNFDYSADRNVTLTDFNILAVNFGKTVAQPQAFTLTTTRFATTARPANHPARQTDLLEEVGLI